MTPVKTSLKGALRNLFHRRQQLCLEQLLGSHLFPCSCPCHTRHPTDPFTRKWINRPKSLTKISPQVPISQPGTRTAQLRRGMSNQAQGQPEVLIPCESSRDHRIRDKQGETPEPQLYTLTAEHCAKNSSHWRNFLENSRWEKFHCLTLRNGQLKHDFGFLEAPFACDSKCFQSQWKAGHILPAEAEGWGSVLARFPFQNSCMTTGYSISANHSTIKWFQMLACLSEWWGLIRSCNERHHRGVGYFCWSGASCRLQHSFNLFLSQSSTPRPSPQNILNVTTVISKIINTALTHHEPMRRSREQLLTHKVPHSSCPKAGWKFHSSRWELHSHN